MSSTYGTHRLESWRAEPIASSGVQRQREPPGLRDVDPGERLLIPCVGGPAMSRLVYYPAPLEIEVTGGIYVLVDDGPPATWRYDFVPDER